MTAEDFDEFAEYQKIASDLAECDVVAEDEPMGASYCTLCRASQSWEKDDDLLAHLATCPWLRAVELVGRHRSTVGR